MDDSIKVIDGGKLEHIEGKKVSYTVTNGWDVKTSMECDRLWKASYVELLDSINALNLEEAKLFEVLSSLSLEDSHWNWFQKAVAYHGPEFEWFHLYAEDKPQGACVIYHPQASALSGLNIFYVEFIAVAPWNRTNLIRERMFKRVGRLLLRSALNFSISYLRLTPGFCLHSLPGACGFYTDLQMVRINEKSKDALTYFELPEAFALKLMEAV